MKLIREEIENVEVIVEERGGKKNLFIEGVFLQGDIKNRNGRLYPAHTLAKEVDKFVIAEATRNHAGEKKNLNFKIENFVKFKDKIEYLVIDDIPINVGTIKKGWHSSHLRDQFQRNSLERGYKDCSLDISVLKKALQG